MQEIKPYPSNLSKKKQVEEMFNNVAATYDKVNRVLSFYIDVYWRKVLLTILNKQNPKNILDVATGTGDLALVLAKNKNYQVTGYDLSAKMLEVAKRKASKNLSQNLSFIHGDAENMPFEDNQFDAITVSFGVRNFENLEKGLQEMNRVLKPNGKLYILEFSQPTNFIFKSIYFFYFTKVLPFVGGILSKDRQAYAYLPNSVYNFPFGKQMLSLLHKNQYKETQFKSLTFGIASIYTAKK
jgi:demethylmenaquinone methyltransferase / 2-methoxy-6-polyprenyl-1,4-benzoquinol methylase